LAGSGADRCWVLPAFRSENSRGNLFSGVLNLLIPLRV
jgi:hypothetical protein